MYSIRFFVLCLFALFWAHLGADPMLFWKSVDLVAGKVVASGEIRPQEITYTHYARGTQQVAGEEVVLGWFDAREGKVRSALLRGDQEPYFFFYEQRCTSIVYPNGRYVKYFYDQQGCATLVEEYPRKGAPVYRKQRFFWELRSGQPVLTASCLENGQGEAVRAHMQHYSSEGRLLGYTIYGNLSGECAKSIVMGDHGIPEENGIESDRTSYEYHADRVIGEIKSSGERVLYTNDAVTGLPLYLADFGLPESRTVAPLPEGERIVDPYGRVVEIRATDGVWTREYNEVNELVRQFDGLQGQ